MRKTRSELRPLVTLRISSIAVAPKASCRPRNTAALFSCGIISLRCYWIGGTTIETDDDADRWCPQGFWAQSCHCSPGKERAKTVSDHVFHDVLKLAHIARPIVLHQNRLDFARDVVHAPSAVPHVFQDEMMDDRGNVLEMFAQRGRFDGQHFQPVVKVPSKLAGRDRSPEIAIRGGDHSNIDGYRPLTADSVQLSILEHAKQLRLGGKRHFPDLIQKQCSARCLFEFSFLLFDSSRERSPFMSEHLTFQKRLRQGPTVHHHQGARGSRALRVQRAGDEFLSSPAFAFNKNVRACGCRLENVLPQLRHHGAIADELLPCGFHKLYCSGGL